MSFPKRKYYSAWRKTWDRYEAGLPQWRERSDMLKDNPEVCTLMPCTFGVYEGSDGKVYISSMNQHLMGEMFGSTIAKVMSEYVMRDQAKILRVCGKDTFR